MPTATPTIETYAGLQDAYTHFNRALFDSALPEALITLQRERVSYGYFCAGRFGSRDKRQADEIAMNPAFFGLRPIPDTLSTLVHEMTHLWQQHFGTPGRGRYHNTQWARKMEAIGLMPTATGKPGGRKTGDRMAHHVIDGGPFSTACAALLTTTFALAWYDRFPPPGVALPKGGVGGDVDLAGAAGADDGDGGEDEAPARPDRRKVKYRCPACGVQVWGKPGIKLFCGEDGAELAAAPAKPRFLPGLEATAVSRPEA